MTSIIEVSGLRKEYRPPGFRNGVRGQRTVAVDCIDMAIDRPGVYGFLGPNGSGKTTTIRCLLGLVRPTAGDLRVLGTPITDLGAVVHRIGALVEGPKFSPDMTARTNLELLARLGGVAVGRIHEVLELVELADRADEHVGGYSLGMTQRLGVAAAILRDPELVILDEPGNGLDPAGIADMRRLVRRLSDEGRTIFVSSHQLAEVQQMCDEVIIVAKGRNVVSGRVDDIVTAASGVRMIVTIEHRDEALAVLETSGFAALPALEPDQIVVQLDDGRQPASITRALAGTGLYVSGLRADSVSLEQAFLALTGDDVPAVPSVEPTVASAVSTATAGGTQR